MTNLPLSGVFTITARYHKVKEGLWKTLGFHTGIDFIGSDNIYATCDGTVVDRKYSNGYGNHLIIKEDGIDRYHLFGHLASYKVNVGDRVSRTTIIGIMGNTGTTGTGKHLHYEIRNVKDVLKPETLINPADYCGIPNEEGTYNSANYQINPLNIVYNSYCQNILWHGEKRNWEMSGPYGNFLRIEAVIINADINIQYRVHMEGIGWGPWVPNGCMAGTTGESRRIEAIEIQSSSATLVGQGYVENIGFQNEVRGTQIVIGTTGQGLRLEGFRLKFA